jgi:hypothetical protein
MAANFRYCTAQNFYSDILELFCCIAFTTVVIHRQVKCANSR